jgi:hypothetical protein
MSEPESVPLDPITPMREAAASMRELYLEYVSAGFTPYSAESPGEAMHLLVELMKTNFQPPTA